MKNTVTLKNTIMKNVIMLLIITTGLFACKKSDCEINKTGTITVSNNSSNPYDFYIDGVYKGRLAGKSISGKYSVSQGNNREFYVIQVSGYLFSPTKLTNVFNVVSCNNYTWQIP